MSASVGALVSAAFDSERERVFHKGITLAQEQEITHVAKIVSSTEAAAAVSLPPARYRLSI